MKAGLGMAKFAGTMLEHDGRRDDDERPQSADGGESGRRRHAGNPAMAGLGGARRWARIRRQRAMFLVAGHVSHAPTGGAAGQASSFDAALSDAFDSRQRRWLKV
jgi:hypothetical protein